jgi:hypothetical protein
MWSEIDKARPTVSTYARERERETERKKERDREGERERERERERKREREKDKSRFSACMHGTWKLFRHLSFVALLFRQKYYAEWYLNILGRLSLLSFRP